MDRVATQSLAEAILSAPAWVRVGITAPTEALRLKAANELAVALLTAADDASHDRDDGQLQLAL